MFVVYVELSYPHHAATKATHRLVSQIDGLVLNELELLLTTQANSSNPNTLEEDDEVGFERRPNLISRARARHDDLPQILARWLHRSPSNCP
jgi:hypothetical protein